MLTVLRLRSRGLQTFYPFRCDDKAWAGSSVNKVLFWQAQGPESHTPEPTF